MFKPGCLFTSEPSLGPDVWIPWRTKTDLVLPPAWRVHSNREDGLISIDRSVVELRMRGQGSLLGSTDI